METDGCYAVNFMNKNKRKCELTSGLSDDDEMFDDVNFDIYIIGEYFLVDGQLLYLHELLREAFFLHCYANSSNYESTLYSSAKY